MTGRFEQDVQQACATFIGEIEAAVIAAIHAAFAQVSARAVNAVAAPRAGIPALDPLPPRRAPVPASRPTDFAALRERLLSGVRDNPGSTTAQLGRRLGIHTAKLRRQLVRLAAEGAIRCEDRPSGFGSQQWRAYFPGEREVARATHVIDQTHGEPSAAPSTILGASP